LTSGWRPSRGEYIRYFIVASVVLIGQIVGLLFIGLWVGRRVSFWMGVLGATLGAMVGLASGSYCLYRMALNWERKVLEKTGKQVCINCKRSFEIDVQICPHCGYETAPTTQNPSCSD